VPMGAASAGRSTPVAGQQQVRKAQ